MTQRSLMSVTGRRSATGGGGGGGGVKDCGGMDRKLLRLIGKALALRGNTVGVYACVSDDGGDGSTNGGATNGGGASSGKGRDSSSGKGRAAD